MRKITTSAHMPTEIKVENVSENVAKIIAYPFETGYAVTLAHPLRRLLYTSTVGFAPTAVKIEGVSHEFDSMRGMLEDMAAFIINLKSPSFYNFVLFIISHNSSHDFLLIFSLFFNILFYIFFIFARFFA